MTNTIARLDSVIRHTIKKCKVLPTDYSLKSCIAINPVSIAKKTMTFRGARIVLLSARCSSAQPHLRKGSHIESRTRSQGTGLSILRHPDRFLYSLRERRLHSFVFD